MNRVWYWPVAALSLAIMSCGDPSTIEQGAFEKRVSPSNGTSMHNATKRPEISDGLRAAHIASVQRDAPSSYVAHEENQIVRMSNAAQRFASFADREGLTIAPNNREWQLQMRAASVGCDGASESILAAAPTTMGNRVEVHHDGLEEWYLNGPLGVEHGFVLQKAPACAGPKRISISVTGDLTATLDDADAQGRGTSVAFRDQHGQRRLGYSDLFVKDARGSAIPTWFSVASNGTVSIVIDDEMAAYPLLIDPLLWTQQIQLLPKDLANSFYFGESVHINGDLAIVGTPSGFVTSNASQGTAYIFAREGGTWVEKQKIYANDGQHSDQFGTAVAISGDTAIVGAVDALDDGAVYVFTYDGTTWTQTQKIESADPSYFYLGNAVSISGNTIAVADYWALANNTVQGGTVDVFVRNGATWTLQQKLTAPQPATAGMFGASVALDGDTLLVGEADEAGSTMNMGHAYVFTRNGTTWTLQQQLTSSAPAIADRFGFSVALSGDTALVGAFGTNLGVKTRAGAAYAFVRSGTTWTQQQQLVASDAQNGDSFGYGVALSGDLALVGAIADAPNFNVQAGTVYAFSRNAGAWSETQNIAMPDPVYLENFGGSLSISGTTALLGRPKDKIDAKESAGSAYIYVLANPNGGVCTSPADCVSGACVDGVCCNSACGGGDPSDCQACSIAAGSSVDGTCGPVPPGMVCRASQGACDAAETCNGLAMLCPIDAIATAGTVCRASVGACDIADFCDGAKAECPSDAVITDGSACMGGICKSGICTAEGGVGGNGGSGGSGGSGSGAGGNEPGDQTGCTCQWVGMTNHSSYASLPAILLAIGSIAGRRRRGTRSSKPPAHSSRTTTSLFLSTASLLVLSGGLGCGGDSTRDESGHVDTMVRRTSSREVTALRQRFPERAGVVLEASEMFTETNDAFVRGMPQPSTEHWNHLGVTLPREADKPIQMRLPDGFSWQVREVGREGDAALADRAIAYRRKNGTSFWNIERGGVEEWITVEAGRIAPNEPIARWEVTGARLRQEGSSVLVIDSEGRARVVVSAPEAYTASGRKFGVRMVASGAVLELYANEMVAEAALVDPSWTAAGPLNVGRRAHVATKLANGKVLVTGGYDAAGAGAPFVELYDPSTNIWSFAPTTNAAQVGHSATLLNDGRVLVVGAGAVEIYDPTINSWTIGPGVAAGLEHTATLLADGRVLVAGGSGSDAYLYDAVTNTWTAAAPMATLHYRHNAELLPNGKVILTAGRNALEPSYATMSEIYDPATDTWTLGPSLTTGRDFAKSVRLANGKVLITGGITQSSFYSTFCELYDPVANTWSLTGSMLSGRRLHTATLLPNGQVLIAGGFSNVSTIAAELYDPTLGNFTFTASMANEHWEHTAVRLNDGRVLVAGGGGAQQAVTSVEIFSLTNAVQCAGPANCATGFCVDGYCCNSACGGGAANDCQACNVNGAQGICSPLPSGTQCRAASDSCDAAELCNGVSTSCPVDTFSPSGTLCRGASSACDEPEVCPGNMATCPANVLKPNGTTCNDGNLCTQMDTCNNGFCQGQNPIVCGASDACHVPGSCNPSTGICSNPAKADGAACNDNDLCTQMDSCQTGVCVGQNPIVCMPADTCHVAGVCDPQSGLCSNPAKMNGSTCNDGNLCTQMDTCNNGFCQGQNPIVCGASDACHLPGSCNPSTGLCSNPAKMDGAACNDNDACTQMDSCQTGVCVGQNPTVCAAADTCHVAGVCDSQTGLCSNPEKANGAMCNDGNLCTQVDTCTNGVCQGQSVVDCIASDACHDAGVCNPSTGICSNPAKADGAACDDNDLCTQLDSCQTGVCVGGNPVTCSENACRDAGVCDPQTGQCTGGPKQDGTPCSDNDACTQLDACNAGECIGKNPVPCADADECHEAGVCDKATGECSNMPKADGTPCNQGTCKAGSCVKGEGGAGGAGGMAGEGGAAGSGKPLPNDGCACNIAGNVNERETNGTRMVGLLGVVAFMFRRRNTSR